MKRIKFEFLIVAAGLTTFVLFQNCSGDFKFDKNADGGLQISSINHPKVAFGIADGTTPVTEQQIMPAKDYTVAYSGDASLASEIHFAITPGSSNGANCRFTAGSAMTSQTLRCVTTGSSSITVSVVFLDGSTDSIQRDLFVSTTGATPTPTPGPSATPSNLVIFNIAAGTGVNGMFNDMSTPVLVFVGQTLRIQNNDNVNHQLHTGGVPCPHQNPAPSAPGGHYDCLIGAAHSATAGDVYEHLTTVTPKPFYIKALDGAAIYSMKCSNCHGNLPGSSKRNKSFATIKAAMANVGAMSGVMATDDEVHAIEFILSH